MPSWGPDLVNKPILFYSIYLHHQVVQYKYWFKSNENEVNLYWFKKKNWNKEKLQN